MFDKIMEYKKTGNNLSAILELRKSPRFVQNEDPEIIRVRDNIELWNHLEKLQLYVKSCIGRGFNDLKAKLEDQCRSIDNYLAAKQPNSNTKILSKQTLEAQRLEFCKGIFHNRMEASVKQQGNVCGNAAEISVEPADLNFGSATTTKYSDEDEMEWFKGWQPEEEANKELKIVEIQLENGQIKSFKFSE